MAHFVIEGGRPLKGTLKIQGAKNEVLQLLCAVLLTKEEVVIENIPAIKDVMKLISLLSDMGVETQEKSSGTWSFRAVNINADYLQSTEYKGEISKLRGSVMILGPLLSRFNTIEISKPGGDKIGRRNLDTHFHAIEKLGVKFEYRKETKTFAAWHNTLKGSDILLEEPSITGTANVLMAAVRASGTTTIYNAACEPYIQSLCEMLIKMGAKIQGVGSNLLKIEGVLELGGCSHRVSPDMIEIGSFMALGGISNADLVLKDIHPEKLGQIPVFFRKIGLNFEIKGNDIRICDNDEMTIQKNIDGSVLSLYDAPWPGLSPDLISVMLIMCTQAKGNILIHQKMFESRLFFVDRLIEMGAQIILCDPHRAVVIGMNRTSNFRAINMSSPDIRAGIALLIGALTAEGTSTISNINQIDRGYENIENRLNQIGANIQRIH